ncbi:MAG: D-alanyl-D-alanine carboxypeptidase, partial [Bradyrhizobium sp.]|nr:D-alanyl-D-alanine carboxypeptidase [Bradyrhizobium sp.]
EPVIVYTGPTKTGPALIAAAAVDSDQQTPRRAKKGRTAGKKPVAAAEAKDAKPDARISVTIDPNVPIKPRAKHASARPEAAPAKPAAAAAKPASKPAKPKTAAKPATKPAPKNSTTGDAPADQKTAAAPRS